MSLWVSFLAVMGGLVVLVWSADRFVAGAASIARNLGISPLLVGLTIVGFGTSAPEMVVAGFAAAQGNPGLALGNAVGSNITNIALVLGATAMAQVLIVRSGLIKREMPVLFVVQLLVLGILLDGELSRLDGILLFGSLIGIMTWISMATLQADKNDPVTAEIEEELPETLPATAAWLWFAVGLILLLLSSRLLVWGAVDIAQSFGVSDLIIGLTIVAIGTSLPELAASITSALKNEADLAIGNVIGSNLFNVLGVIAIPALIIPHSLPEGLLIRDYPIMIALTALLFFMALGFKGQGKITRLEGGVLLGCFVAYQVFLFMSVAPSA